MRIQNSGGLNNSWQLDVFDYDGTNFINTVLASNLNAGQVYQLGFEQTFNPGALNDTWSVSLNGTNLFNGIGWEDYFVDQSETVMPYDRLLFRAGGASVANAKGVVFDNVRYASVPEPASMTALALGGLALLKRKRKQSS